MKFIDRESELKFLGETRALSKNKLFSVSIAGLRRIGKTRLILEILKEKDLYFFVNKDKRSESLLSEYEEELRNRKILTELERLESWDDFFKLVFERFRGVIAFDEFQNFSFVNKSLYGTLQKYIDLNENRKGILLIFSGSLAGLIKKLFSDKKEPLYGRIKRKLVLNQLSFGDVFRMCSELDIINIDEVVRLYAIFGGFPKYYVAIEDENLQGKSFEEIINKLFFAENAPLEDEVNQILSLEFGKRSGIYYDILCAIANGNTKISEIASFLRKKETAITRQINELTNYFEIVGVEESLINKKRVFYIKHPLMNFWFRYFYKNLSAYKRGEKWLIEKIRSGLNAYIGRQFEKVCREQAPKLLGRKFKRYGKWWGFHRDENGERKTVEIDMVAFNEDVKEILFGECKWKEKVDAERILKELSEKTKFVGWFNAERKESFAVFAKSFRKKVREYEGKEVHCFDLKDLERILK